MNANSGLKRLHRSESNEPPQEPVPVTTLVLVPKQGKALFADSLLETASGQRRRIWAVVFSSALQCLLVGTIVILPLWYTKVLPRQELLTMLTIPPSPPPAPPPASVTPKAPRTVGNIAHGVLMAPSRIPSTIFTPKEPEPPAFNGGGVMGGVPGGMPGGEPGGMLGGIPTSRPQVVMQSAPTPKRVRISQGITEGMILSKVDPIYPPIAVAARVEGIVMLKAIIAKDGTIQNLQVLSGSPMLVPAAVDAVKQWRYRPYLLNGEPVEVETSVQVTFILGESK